MKELTPNIREVRLDDAAAIAQLKSMYRRDGDKWLRRFKWQFVDNPAREPGRAVGWVLEAHDGRILGHEMEMPHRFWIFGEQQYVGISVDTFVDPQLRGRGFGKKLFDVYFEAQRGKLVLSTSANEATVSLWTKAGCSPIGDLNLVYSFAYRSAAGLRGALPQFTPSIIAKSASQVMGRLKDLLVHIPLPPTENSITCEEVGADDDRLDDIWTAYKNDYGITVVRDEPYRRWRYQDSPTAMSRVFLVTDSLGPSKGLRAWFVLRLARRGRLSSVCELLDVYGPLGEQKFQNQVIAWAIRTASTSGGGALEVRALHPEWRRLLPKLGLKPNLLPANPYYYRNTGNLEESKLQNPATWHLCAADGDAAL